MRRKESKFEEQKLSGQLNDLGWDEYFATHYASHDQASVCAARIALEYGQTYRIYTAHGELSAEMAGRLKHEATRRQDLPAVGDWVVVQPRFEERKATIQAILPRRTQFIRKVAGKKSVEQVVGANIDTVFIVSALNQDFNARRIERYLTASWESGAAPVVILNKTDLCADLESKIADVEAVAAGVPIHAISALHDDGLDAIRLYFKVGKTVALLGSSGVGKSTLINRLVGRDIQKVREIRLHDDRGRHTTTHRELILLPQGGLVLDTPGMRELQFWEGESGLRETFDDIEEFAKHCYYSDCSHQNEPGCAVQEAIVDGRLGEGRLASYEKLRRELDYMEKRRELGAKTAEKQRWKKAIEAQRSKENRR